MSFDYGNDPFTNMYGKYNILPSEKQNKKTKRQSRLEKTLIQNSPKQLYAKNVKLNIEKPMDKSSFDFITYKNKPYNPKGSPYVDVNGNALQLKPNPKAFDNMYVGDSSGYNRSNNPKIYNERYPNTKSNVSKNANQPNLGKGGKQKYNSLPTLAQMADTNNYADAPGYGFYENPRRRTLGDSGGYKVVNGRKVYEANPSKYDLYVGEQNAKADGVPWNPIFVEPVNKKIQDERSRGAGDKLTKIPFTTGLQPFSGKKPEVPTVKLSPPVSNKAVVSPYLANYKPGPSIQGLSSKLPASSLQNKFSQDIKLLSGGFSLDNKAARDAIASASASSSARVQKINQANLQKNLPIMKSDPDMAEANRILAEQGEDYRFEVDVIRRRRGHYYPVVVKKYIGPTVDKSYTYTSSRGQQSRITKYLSSGMNVSRPGTIGSVISDYNKTKSVLDFALKHTDIKPTTDIYDPSLNATVISSRIKAIEDAGRKVTTKSSKKGQLPLVLVGTGKAKRYEHQTIDTVGTGSVKVGDLMLTQAEADELKQLKSLLPKAGIYGETAYTGKVLKVAQERKSILDKYIDPIDSSDPDSIYTYAAYKENDISDIQNYSKNLKDISVDYDKNISLIKEGIEKTNVVRGKKPTTTPRAGLFDYVSTIPVLSSLEQLYKPLDETSKQTSSKIKELTVQKDILTGDYRNKVADLVKGGLFSYGDIDPTSIKETVSKQVIDLRQQADALDKQRESMGAPNGSQTKLRQLQSMRTSAEEMRSNANKLESDRDFIISNESYIEKVERPVAVIKGIGDSGLGRTSKYSFAGSRTLKIPKDQVPESGIVTLQLTYSFTPNATAQLSSNLGVLEATGSAGNPNFPGASRGEGVVVADLPVDNEGNIQLSFDLQGKKKYPYEGTLQLHDAIVYKPMSSAQKVELEGVKTGLSSQQQQFDMIESQKKYLKDAQSFLTGQTDVFMTDKGNVAKVAGGKVTVTNVDEFSKFFSGLSPDAIATTRDVYKPLGIVTQKKTQLQERLKSETVGTPQYLSVNEEIQNIDNLSKFITGDISSFDIMSGGTKKPIAKRLQTGYVEILDPTEYSKFGVTLPTATKYGMDTTNIALLESNMASKEKLQQSLIEELKVVQKERVKESAVAKQAQVDQLLQRRVISRRDAIKMKQDIGNDVASQNSIIDNVEGIPDIEVFDTDLKSEAQEILENTGKIITEQKRGNAGARLRQVTRSRPPQASPVGSVLRLGQTVPRPSDDRPPPTTTLGANLTGRGIMDG